MKTRKTVLSGTNDFPDGKEKLGASLRASSFFRAARPFEELRLEVEKMNAPSVFIALYGDYGALNARLNFVKNYFELLGLHVLEPGHSVTDVGEFKRLLKARTDEIIVLCAADDHYAALGSVETEAKFRYVAGKTEMPGFKNLFAGQNVYEVLQELVSLLKAGAR